MTERIWDIVTNKAESKMDFIPKDEPIAHEVGLDCICGPTIAPLRCNEEVVIFMYYHTSVKDGATLLSHPVFGEQVP